MYRLSVVDVCSWSITAWTTSTGTLPDLAEQPGADERRASHLSPEVAPQHRAAIVVDEHSIIRSGDDQPPMSAKFPL